MYFVINSDQIFADVGPHHCTTAAVSSTTTVAYLA
jgi:hypothetical protein